ncbi:MAG: CPBP family intramembrane metalloprotease [bacterium]|nr:CPBP family intramembrane metalloprotease [bacterium]
MNHGECRACMRRNTSHQGDVLLVLILGSDMLKELIQILNPGAFFSREKTKPTIILLLAAILPTIHLYFGSIAFANKTFPFLSSFGASIYMFLSFFLLMGIIPLFIILFVFKEPLQDYGITPGDWRKGLPLAIFLTILIAVLLLLPSSQTPDFRATYPFDKTAGDSTLSFIRFELLRGMIFYTAWEFFFRGFMLFGLRKYVGDWLAICIQTIPSCLWHIGLPIGEILSSILAGILFGIIAIRTKSIFWVFVLHYFIGLLLDLFIVIS